MSESLKAYSIYWICKKTNLSIPWYVGITTNILRRWKEHQDNFLYRTNVSVLKRLLEDVANNNVVIRRIETIYCTKDDAIIAERNAIVEAALINPELLNVQNKTAENCEVSVVQIQSLFPMWAKTHSDDGFDDAIEFIKKWRKMSCESLHGDILAIQLAALDAFQFDVGVAQYLTSMASVVEE